MLLTLFFSLFLSLQAEVVHWLSPKTHNFGQVEQYEPVRTDFRFRNTSGQPIFIDNVRTTCGCTVPNWTRNVILPDSTSSIQVEYDARKQGAFRKRILVFFSGQRKAEKLFIEGEVQ